MCIICVQGFPNFCLDSVLSFTEDDESKSSMRAVDSEDLEILEAYDEIDSLADEDPFAHEEVYEEIEKDLSRERGRGKKF